MTFIVFCRFDFTNDPVNPSNVAQYGQKFVDMVNSRLPWYKTSNILAEWGCDFQFQLTKSRRLASSERRKDAYNVTYSVLSDYYKSVWEGGDFFPYFADLWWTGYYTSRVELKGWVRVGEAISHLGEPSYQRASAVRLDSLGICTFYNRFFDNFYFIEVDNFRKIRSR